MYIVLNIFRLHGGAITLDSSYTDGAKFLIKMPKQMEEIK
jgi:signal transduction histidine kinase